MTWAIPNWWAFVLLALAAYRTWRLLAEDEILDPMRNRFVKPDTWRERFVECPWCAGFWVMLIWWLAWTAWPHWTLIVAVPFAINAVQALIAVRLDPD